MHAEGAGFDPPADAATLPNGRYGDRRDLRPGATLKKEVLPRSRVDEAGVALLQHGHPTVAQPDKVGRHAGPNLDVETDEVGRRETVSVVDVFATRMP